MKAFSESLRYEYNLTAGSRVLDVGCYEGNWSFEIWKRYGCAVVAMEPVPDFYWRCVRKLSTVPGAVLKYALGGETRNVMLGVHGDRSGLHSDGPQVLAQVISLMELMDKLRWEDIHLLKLNCEGMEYEILNHAIDTNLIHHIENIQVQFHNISETSRSQLNEIRSKLGKTHTPEYMEEWIWEGWRRK